MSVTPSAFVAPGDFEFRDSVFNSTLLAADEAESVTPPTFKERAVPKYPLKAKTLGFPTKKDQNVKLRISVSEKGNLEKATVIEGVSGNYGFDEAAVEAALKSKYNPGTRDGKPAGGTMEVAYTFKAQQ